jgi:hypothetical protein
MGRGHGVPLLTRETGEEKGANVRSGSSAEKRDLLAI